MRPRTIVIVVLLLIVLFTAHHSLGQAIAAIAQQAVKFGHFLESGRFQLK